MRFGKPLTVAWVLIFVTLAGCGVAEFEETSDEEVEYTNIEYLENGKEVRLYLDGVGVPSTRAQRAITKDLAQAAFDFIEVVFVNGSLTSPNVARASWILGQPANIGNIDRGTTSTGLDYGNVYPATTDGPAACMFVGREYGKILLGVGRLTGTRNEDGTAGTTSITKDTRSVTFSISPLQSGLLVGSETTAPGVVYNSFTYTAGGSATGYVSRVGNSFRVPLAGISYPVYSLPVGLDYDSTQLGSESDDPSRSVTFAEYEFSVASTHIAGIRHAAGGIVIERRVPRYADGNKYKEPRNLIDTVTKVSSRSSPAPGAAFTNPILLRFCSGTKDGILAFNMRIPVYMVTDSAAGRTGNLAAVTWNIRTGVGSEIFSIDDGVSRGGCVLMTVGITSDDWSKVEWTWFKGF